MSPKQLPQHLPALQRGCKLLFNPISVRSTFTDAICRPFTNHDTSCFLKRNGKVTHVCQVYVRETSGEKCVHHVDLGVLARMSSTAAASSSNSGIVRGLPDSRNITFCLLVGRTTASFYTTSQSAKQTQPRLLHRADVVQTSSRQGSSSTRSTVLFLTCQ